MITRRNLLKGTLSAPMMLMPRLSSASSLFPNNKSYAVTFSIDDGFWESSQKFDALFQFYKMRATFHLPTSWITPMRSEIGDPPNVGRDHGTWSNWKTLLDKGHEIASHTMTHPHLPNLPLDQVKRELLYSKRRLTQRLKLYGPKTFGFPYNASSPEVKELVAKYYLAARVGGEGINIPGEIDYMNISSWWPLTTMSIDESISKIKEAKAKNAWLVIGLHGMDEEGWNPISQRKMRIILHFLANDFDAHVGTFKDVASHLMKTT